MRNVLVLPVVGLMVACAQDVHPDEDIVTPAEDVEQGSGGSGDGDGDESPARAISIVLTSDPVSCDNNSRRLFALVRYIDTGDTVDAATCRFQFEDGTAVDGCFIEHSLPTLQNVVVTAVDSATGATATATDAVRGPSSFSTTLDVTSNGLSISWDAHTLYGDALDVAGVAITIQPSENVVVTDPGVFADNQGTVQVTQPGMYTVSVRGSIFFGESGGGCTASSSQTIEVCHEGDGHEHHVR